MDRKLNLKIGDKCIIAIIPMSNASRYIDMNVDNIDEWTFGGTVIKKTNKYLTFKWESGEEKFSVENIMEILGECEE